MHGKQFPNCNKYLILHHAALLQIGMQYSSVILTQTTDCGKLQLEVTDIKISQSHTGWCTEPMISQ